MQISQILLLQFSQTTYFLKKPLFFCFFQLQVDLLGDLVPSAVLPGPPALTQPARERIEMEEKKKEGKLKRTV